jgi:hypothetical protein
MLLWSSDLTPKGQMHGGAGCRQPSRSNARPPLSVGSRP